MAFNDLFDSGKHKKNLGHFACIVTLASSDGAINDAEEVMLKRFARKLDVDDSEFAEIMKTPNQYPINPPNNKAERLERLYDLFKIIYADHEIDDEETRLIKKYIIGLGFDSSESELLLKKSSQLFSGRISQEDYTYLITNVDR